MESKITTIGVLTDQDNDRIQNIDPTRPAITYDPNVENVGTLSIRISKTSDNTVPSRVQIGIFGCATPTTPGSKPQLITTTPVSTAQPRETTAGMFLRRFDRQEKIFSVGN